VLTPHKSVPSDWFPELHGARVLCLASGGGQQGPILAAAGAAVTVFDNSPRQLEGDKAVAVRHHLNLTTLEGDMSDLSAFGDASFDAIVHPVSNLFVPDVGPVWREAARVLKPGGCLMAGFANPAMYIFDPFLLDKGELKVRFSLPYADVSSLEPEELQRYLEAEEPLEFSHSLEAQIGGQIEAGLLISGLYEDGFEGHPLFGYMPLFIATRSVKLDQGFLSRFLPEAIRVLTS
jgi:SAM-dependent methyltransferase